MHSNEFDNQNEKVFRYDRGSALCYGFSRFVYLAFVCLYRAGLIWYTYLLYQNYCDNSANTNFANARLGVAGILGFTLYFVLLYVNFTQINAHNIAKSFARIGKAQTRIFQYIKMQPYIFVQDEIALQSQFVPLGSQVR